MEEHLECETVCRVKASDCDNKTHKHGEAQDKHAISHRQSPLRVFVEAQRIIISNIYIYKFGIQSTCFF